MKIYITGVSGTGKTTLARALVSKGVQAIDMDGLSRWINKDTGEETDRTPGSFDKSKAWLMDVSKLKEVLAKTNNIVVAEHADNEDEYISLFNKIFVLVCSPETIIARLEQRIDNDFGKHPTDREKILKWHKTFDADMIKKGASLLNAERPVKEIVEEIYAILN